MLCASCSGNLLHKRAPRPFSHRYYRCQKGRRSGSAEPGPPGYPRGLPKPFSSIGWLLGLCICRQSQNPFAEVHRNSGDSRSASHQGRRFAAPGASILMKRIAIALVRFYQKNISPLSPPRCRFYPTCSAYAITAFERFGFVGGFLLSSWRILRCNPLFRGGTDFVPERFLFFGRKS